VVGITTRTAPGVGVLLDWSPAGEIKSTLILRRHRAVAKFRRESTRATSRKFRQMMNERSNRACKWSKRSRL
jgi:hypothetical protein